MVITKNHMLSKNNKFVWSEIKKIASCFVVENWYVFNYIFWKLFSGFQTHGGLKIAVQ